MEWVLVFIMMQRGADNQAIAGDTSAYRVGADRKLCDWTASILQEKPDAHYTRIAFCVPLEDLEKVRYAAADGDGVWEDN